MAVMYTVSVPARLSAAIVSRWWLHFVSFHYILDYSRLMTRRRRRQNGGAGGLAPRDLEGVVVYDNKGSASRTHYQV